MSGRGEERAKASPGVAVEVVASLVALAGPVALLMNLVDAYGFLTSSTPEPRHTIFYAVVAAIMLAGVIWTFASARRRNARTIAYVWHVLVGIWASAAIVLLIVPRWTGSPSTTIPRPWSKTSTTTRATRAEIPAADLGCQQRVRPAAR